MRGDLEFIVSSDIALLPFLLEKLGKSRNNVKSVLRRGQVLIDGKRSTNHALPLRPGQRVTVRAQAPGTAAKLGMPLVYEDDELIVVNKPAGLLPIATDKEREATAYRKVTDFVKYRERDSRIFVVHRLDRDTSGVMLFAKSERLKLALQDEWDNLVTLREYIAVAEGIVHPPEGQVRSYLKQTKTLLVYSSNTEGDGKLAITNYRTLNNSDVASLLEITLETGRKNQIRTHLSELGHPVAGDKKYGAKTNPLGRMCLHASALELRHPFSDALLRFEAKAPSGFAGLFE